MLDPPCHYFHHSCHHWVYTVKLAYCDHHEAPYLAALDRWLHNKNAGILLHYIHEAWGRLAKLEWWRDALYNDHDHPEHTLVDFQCTNLPPTSILLEEQSYSLAGHLWAD